MSKTRIIEVLKTCYDPEIPIDLWNLGLIYDIRTQPVDHGKSHDVTITMSLTTPGCSMGAMIVEDVKAKLRQLDTVNKVEVNMTFNPPWSPDRLTPEARRKLGLGATEQPGEKENRDAWE